MYLLLEESLFNEPLGSLSIRTVNDGPVNMWTWPCLGEDQFDVGGCFCCRILRRCRSYYGDMVDLIRRAQMKLDRRLVIPSRREGIQRSQNADPVLGVDKGRCV